MFNRLKSFAALAVTVLALCGFIMPVVCQSAHAASKSNSVTSMSDCNMMVKKTDSGKNSKQSKSALPDGCVGHHCCAAKLIVVPVQLSAVIMQEAPAVLNPNVNQTVSGANINSLDRPPKNLV